MKYAVVLERGPTSVGAWVPDLPGCVAAAETEAEALRLIHEAVDLHLMELRAGGEEVPAPCTSVTFIEVGQG
jgi:predicted RNase H-like HicB family nuclease